MAQGAGTGRRRQAAPAEPLGSLTRPDQEITPGTEHCVSCGSEQLTRLRLTLADGTEVTFVSCHACEHRAWIPVDGDGTPLTRDEVVQRSSRR
ncbi:hypothetical protein [Cellulomonas denverensis]|uniref:TFIIS-type domain-containing protein n=1 Tax=Cellulomonas denverensis TaxID=264297 RepID=A0A7X6QYZ6_9CELL|nr:hypothetical protein [Cellulomonas denverensis]NKY22541.1 hypothetical protein [Cellulomonas denverensis]GIG24814.1 hypothetical protein Cde04nite_10580 [Cellulomonas denverensis]